MHEAQDREISCYIHVSLSLSCIIIAHFDKLTWMKFIVIVITITFSCILIVVELPAPDRPSCIDTIGVILVTLEWSLVSSQPVDPLSIKGSSVDI